MTKLKLYYNNKFIGVYFSSSKRKIHLYVQIMTILLNFESVIFLLISIRLFKIFKWTGN